MKKVTGQIKALLNSGFKDEQIKEFLGVTDDDIIVALETKEELPKVKARPGIPSKLTEKVWHSAKEMWKNGTDISTLSSFFGISQSYMYKALHFKSYETFNASRERKNEQRRAKSKRPVGRAPKITSTMFDCMKHDLNNGMLLVDVSAKYDIGVGYVQNVAKSDTFAEYEAARVAIAQKKSKQYFDKKYGEQKPEAVSSEVDKVIEPSNEITVNKTKETISPKLVELRSIADSLERIADALERKRGFFRK